jgi:hypothetical protein
VRLIHALSNRTWAEIGSVCISLFLLTIVIAIPGGGWVIATLHGLLLFAVALNLFVLIHNAEVRGKMSEQRWVRETLAQARGQALYGTSETWVGADEEEQ